MRNPVNPGNLQRAVFEAKNDLARVLRAVAHAKRLQLLAILVEGSKEFMELISATKLSKTAIANHLTQLTEKGLIERVERGNYQITPDGHQLLEGIVSTYMRSQRREALEKQKLLERYSRGYNLRSKSKMEAYKLSLKAKYEHGWISYIMAVTGVLKSLSVDCDIIDVAGYSGYAFIVNVAQGVTCPSGPTAHNAWEEIHKGTEVYGWKISSVGEDVSYPLGDAITPEDSARARAHFELVKEGLVRTDRPVVIWGIPVPEYGIVNGYTADSYVVSTFRHLNNQPDPPIRYEALQAPGCLEAIFFEKQITVPDAMQRDMEAIQRAIKMAEGVYKGKGYVSGPDAFEEWAQVLKETPQKVIYHGNSYVAACTHEGKVFARTFLERLSRKYQETQQTKALVKAAEEYQHAEQLMGQYVELFPFSMNGALPKEKLDKGASLLRAVKPHEVKALDHLRTTLEDWE